MAPPNICTFARRSLGGAVGFCRLQLWRDRHAFVTDRQRQRRGLLDTLDACGAIGRPLAGFLVEGSDTVSQLGSARSARGRDDRARRAHPLIRGLLLATLLATAGVTYDTRDAKRPVDEPGPTVGPR
jgi:hypothetical protein